MSSWSEFGWPGNLRLQPARQVGKTPKNACIIMEFMELLYAFVPSCLKDLESGESSSRYECNNNQLCALPPQHVRQTDGFQQPSLSVQAGLTMFASSW